MEYRLYELKKGFNSILNVTENCDITYPAYSAEKTLNDRFFLQKRKGLTEIVDLGSDVLDTGTYESSTESEDLALTTTDLFVYGIGVSTSSVGTSYSDAKMFSVTGPVNGVKEGGTATGGDNPVGSVQAYLEDTSQSWTTDEWAGYYIWLFDETTNPAGAGQIVYISGNDATKIYVEGWTNGNNPQAGTEYSIYDSLGSTVLVSSQSEGKIWVYDGDGLKEVKTLVPFNDVEIHDGRLFGISADNPNIVWYTEAGQYFLFDKNVVTGSDDVRNITKLGEYVVVGRADSLAVLNRFLTGSTEDSGVTINTYDYVITEITAGIGVYDERSVYSWQGGYYFVADNRHIYSLSISSSNDALIGIVNNLSTEYLGAYINFFSEPPIFINIIATYNEIQFIYTFSTTSIAFRYNTDYQGWLVDRYSSSPLRSAKLNLDNVIVFGYSTSVTYQGGDDDLGESFEQKVGFLFGYEDAASYKYVSKVRILFEYQQTDLATFEASVLGNYKKQIVRRKIGVNYSSAFGALGNPIIGTEQLGSWNESPYYSPIFIQTVNMGTHGNFHQFILTDEGNGFKIGDIVVIYRTESPLINSNRTSI